MCVPAGTRNHFALDVGVDRDDLIGALDAFTDGVECQIDMASFGALANRRPGVASLSPRRDRMADSDRRSALLDSYENAAVIVSGIVADELGHPTPCPRYDVAGLIDHLVEAGHRAAALGRGQAPPPGDESPHVELSDAPGQLR